MNKEREPVPDVITALQAPGAPEELIDEDRYLRMFDALGPRRGKSLRPIVIGGRGAVVAVIGVVAVAGVAAAYSGHLPSPLQSATPRHTTVHAPPATAGRSPLTGASSASGQSPGAGARSASPSSAAAHSTSALPPAGPYSKAAPGQCTAWAKGGLPTTSTAYQRLAAAAGGPTLVGAYCASVLHSATQQTHGKKAKTKPPHPTKTSKPGEGHAKGKSAGHGHPTKAAL